MNCENSVEVHDESFVIMVGGFRGGFAVIGPFSTKEMAWEYAIAYQGDWWENGRQDYWEIVPCLRPAGHSIVLQYHRVVPPSQGITESNAGII